MIEAARGYESLFVPAMFDVWPDHLLAAAGVGTGDAVLDIATGTGVLARRALDRVGPAGHVAGLDASAGMLTVAREIEGDVAWKLGAAEKLDFADTSFDRVVSQFGMMFFDNPAAAASEMLRVLKPGGGVAIAVWNDVASNPAYADVIAVLEAEVGDAAADALRLPFRLGDPDPTVRLLADAGFEQVAFQTISETANFASSRQMVEAELRGWLPLFGIHLDEPAIQTVLRRSDRLLAKYAGKEGAAAFPTSAHIFRARKPAD